MKEKLPHNDFEQWLSKVRYPDGKLCGRIYYKFSKSSIFEYINKLVELLKNTGIDYDAYAPFACHIIFKTKEDLNLAKLILNDMRTGTLWDADKISHYGWIVLSDDYELLKKYYIKTKYRKESSQKMNNEESFGKLQNEE